MKIGMNLLLYTTEPDESFFPTGEKLQRMGYDGLEWPIFGTDKKMARKIKKFNAETGLDATTITVFGPGENPIAADKTERKTAMSVLKKKIDVSAELGVKLLAGPITQPLGHFTGEGPTEDEFKRCVEFFQKAGEYAADTGITLVLEYLNRFEEYFINTAADTARLCAAINHPNVKMMVDSFHANIEEKNFYDPLITAKPYLVHIHISENDRGVPGSGNNIRWDDFFRGIRDVGYNGYLTIEAFGQFLPALAAAAKIWRPLFRDPDDVARDGIAFVRKMLA